MRRELAFASSAARPPWSASSVSGRHTYAGAVREVSATDVCVETVSIELSLTSHYELTDRVCSSGSEAVIPDG